MCGLKRLGEVMLKMEVEELAWRSCMEMRMRMKVGDGGRLCRRCCGGVGMEMGLRRVVIIPIIMPAVSSSGEEEEAEFRLFL